MGSRSAFVQNNLALLGFSPDLAVFSAVKELLDNANDSRATQIILRVSALGSGTDADPRGVLIDCSDDGCGIPPGAAVHLAAGIFASSKAPAAGGAAPEAGVGDLDASPLHVGGSLGQHGVGLKALLLAAQASLVVAGEPALARAPMLLRSGGAVWRLGIDAARDAAVAQRLGSAMAPGGEDTSGEGGSSLRAAASAAAAAMLVDADARGTRVVVAMGGALS